MAPHTTDDVDTFIEVAEDCPTVLVPRESEESARLTADPSLAHTRAMRSRRA